MPAKVHCSNCGEGITNFSLSWGRYQWVCSLAAIVPMLAVFSWMQSSIFTDGEFKDELGVSLVELRRFDKRIDVLGTMRNSGDKHWDRVTVEAEFFSPEGHFLDEVSDYMSVGLAPGSEENFRITLANPISELKQEAQSEVRLKITDASLKRF